MAVLNFAQNAMTGENGSWILSIATNYTGTTYADWNGANESISIAAIEALTFADIGYFENFSVYIKKGNERIITTDYTDVQEISRKQEKITWFTFDLQEVLEMTNLGKLLNASVEVVAQWVWTKWQEIIGMKRITKTQPFQLFRFVSAPDANGLSNVFYFVKAVMTGDLALPYTNLSKNDFTGVTFDHEVAQSGNMFIKKEVSVAL